MIEHRRSGLFRGKPRYEIRDRDREWLSLNEVGERYGAKPETVSSRFFIHVMENTGKFSTLSELGHPASRYDPKRDPEKKNRYVPETIYDWAAYKELKRITRDPDEYDRLILAPGKEGEIIKNLRDKAYGTE